MLLQREPARKKKKKRKFIDDEGPGFTRNKGELYDDQNPQESSTQKYFEVLNYLPERIHA